MSATTSAADASSRAAAEQQRRLYSFLGAASKERVTMLLSHYQTLLPVEQASFMQEIERYNEEQSAAALAWERANETWTRYTGPRLQAVQARDTAYVQRLISGKDAPAGSNSDEALVTAKAPCTLEDLLDTRGIFEQHSGESIRVRKLTLYEKLHQNMESHAMRPNESVEHTPDASLPAVSDTGDGTKRCSLPFQLPVKQGAPPVVGKGQRVDAASPSTNIHTESSGHAVVPVQGDIDQSNESSAKAEAPYRSNAYQAVRLAMSFPTCMATTPPPASGVAVPTPGGATCTWNVTGFPIREDELREWFDELDTTGRGTLGFDEFMSYMESLERDFGISKEYVSLREDGERLAKDGRLSFEAFSYLVLRFLRVG